MFAKVHKPKELPTGDNRGSCIKLADYLEKENKGKDDSQRVEFFSHEDEAVSKEDVIKQIDGNNKNLGKNDIKFYMLSFNPSHREQQHILRQITGRDVNKLDELTASEREQFFSEIRKFTRESMTVYAQNFGRENIESGRDLVYFSKIETRRVYKFYDKDVQYNENLIKTGNASDDQLIKTADGRVIREGVEKDGLNVHVHVIVSRNDRLQKTKLSPLSNSRGGKQTFMGREVMQGFNHEKFKERVGERFNELYNYKPRENEMYRSTRRSRETSNALAGVAGSVGLNPVRNVKGKLKGIISEQMYHGQLTNERKVMQDGVQLVKNAAMLVTNPKAGAVSLAKQALSRILSAALER